MTKRDLLKLLNQVDDEARVAVVLPNHSVVEVDEGMCLTVVNWAGMLAKDEVQLVVGRAA